EGVKARKKRTVEKGVIKEFLHNRETAAAMKLKSNGCARANFYSVEPMVRMSNTFVEPGSFSEEELLEDVKLGVYFKNFMEWNIDDVRYQQRYVGNEAYLVEDGELTTPVARPVLEITTKELWSSVDAVACNLEFQAATCGKGEPMQGIPVFTGGPSIRLRSIKLGK
ncbi:MAG: TldD/PmbA family protein, partial [Candidatus Norongarragalinales archaeon]